MAELQRQYIGTSFQSLDDKGRFVLPLKFRTRIGDTFMVLRGPGPCLLVMDTEYFARFAGIVAEMPMFDPDTLKTQRLVLGTSEEAKQDGQGRTQVSQTLRTIAGIGDGKDIVVIGCGSHIEIWGRAKWEAYAVGHSEEDIGDALARAMARAHQSAAAEPPASN